MGLASDIIGQVAAPIIGTGMGMLTANWQDKRQLKQQAKLQDLQIKGNKEMMDYQQGLAMDMWRDTNYSAQVEQMKKAGLNVGLMYKSAGEGGRIALPTGGVSSGTAPSGGGEIAMGMQIGLQTMLMKEQIENIKADTALKNANANKTSGVDTSEAWARIGKIAAETQNEQIKSEILGFQATMADIEANIAEMTAEQLVKQSILETQKLEEQIRGARNANKITEDTMTSTITQLNKAVEEQTLRIAAQKLGLVKMNADIEKVNTEISKLLTDIFVEIEKNQQNWEQLDVNKRQIVVNEAYQKNRETMTQFQTSTPAKLKQWVDVIEPFMSNRTQKSGQLVGAATRVLTAK